MSRPRQVGIDRVVKLSWIDVAASLSQGGMAPSAVKKALQTELAGSFRSTRTDVRGSIDKTITILMKIWVAPRSELSELQQQGLQILSGLPRRNTCVVHWGMLSAAYPFWFDVAIQTGRLLKLQGTAAATQVQRRIREQYGERETVSRRVRYVLRSFVDWDLVRDSETAGVYVPGTISRVEDARVTAWLAEVILRSQDLSAIPVNGVFDSPGLFPFTFHPYSAREIVDASSRLDVIRQGLDSDLLVLRS